MLLQELVSLDVSNMDNNEIGNIELEVNSEELINVRALLMNKVSEPLADEEVCMEEFNYISESLVGLISLQEIFDSDEDHGHVLFLNDKDMFPISVDDNGVEEILFDDPSADYYVPQTETREFVDRLDTVIELQERMAIGMKMINEIDNKNKNLNTLFIKYNKLSNEDVNKYKVQFWTKANKILQEEYPQGWAEYRAAKARLNKYWTHWKSLSTKCQEVASPDLWSAFFTLVNFEFSPYWAGFDNESVDSQEWLHGDDNDVADCLRDSHILEMAEYDVDVKDYGDSFTWNQVKYRSSWARDMTKQAKALSKAMVSRRIEAIGGLSNKQRWERIELGQ